MAVLDLAIHPVRWPRASTRNSHGQGTRSPVDARVKPGHDTSKTDAENEILPERPYPDAYGVKPGHDGVGGRHDGKRIMKPHDIRSRLAASVVLVCAAGPAVAQTTISFADWHADAPGVHHLITPGELPAPYASRSQSNSPSVVATRGHGAPSVPPGFTAELWARGLQMPRVLRTAPNGDVFLAESGAGQIRVFRIGPDGQAGAGSVFATGLTLPFGIAFWPPAAPRYVYVAATDRIVRYPYASGDTVARGPAEEVVASLPQGGHWTRDLAVAPDGSAIFVSIGSETNIATAMSAAPRGGVETWQRAHGFGAAWDDETGRADVLAFAPDKAAPGEPGLRSFATGLRNCSGLAVQPATGALWCATNERDGLGDNLPPDYATHVAAGGFYGWPWYYIGAHEDPRLRGRRPDLAGHVSVPDVLIQPHSAPLGIAFYDSTMFPPAYRGDAFVALHGSWNRGVRTGYKVIRLRFENGRPTGGYDDFLTGFVLSDSEVWGRPVALTVARDGSLLVSEDGNGTIWRIAYHG
jgi:glucose/arabinose dehydrogenase